MDASDAVSSTLGFVMSATMSATFLSFAQEAVFALLFGVLGAVGGWLANRFIIKPIERRWFKKKEK